MTRCRRVLVGCFVAAGLLAAAAGCPESKPPAAQPPTPQPKSGPATSPAPDPSAAVSGSASPPSAAPPAAPVVVQPWAEPIVRDKWAVMLDGVRVASRFSLTRGNTSTYAVMRVTVQAHRMVNDEPRFAIKSVRLDELRDQQGRDLTRFRTGNRNRNFSPTPGDGVTSSDMWFDGIAELPEWLSIVRGEMEVSVMDGVMTADVPIVDQKTWTPVPGIAGMMTLISVDETEGLGRPSGASLLLRTAIPAGAKASGPPHLESIMLVPPKGETKGLSRESYERIVEGAEIERYNISSFGLDLDQCAVRICAATTETIVKLPFEFRNIPAAGDPSTPMQVVAPSPEPFPVFTTDDVLTQARPGLEKDGLVLRQLWVEAESEIDSKPGRITMKREAKITASLEDLLRSRIYAASPRLTLTEVTDESGRDLLAQAVQTRDIYGGPRGWFQPREGSNPQGGQMIFELKGPMRLPKKLGIVKGHTAVQFATGEESEKVSLEPSEEMKALEIAPQIKVRVVRESGSIRLEYTRPYTDELPSSSSSWKPSRETSDAGPPFVLRLDFYKGEKRIKKRAGAIEHPEKDGVRGVFPLQPNELDGVTLKLVVLKGVDTIQIDFEHKDVPVAAWK